MMMERIEKALDQNRIRPVDTGGRARAAVAIILDQKYDHVQVLFIERSANENDPWSGDIAFPGGKVEATDSSLRETAERETLEELGIDLSHCRFLGQVSDVVPTGLDIVVSGFVYAVETTPSLYPAREEVARAFWLPLAEMMNPLRRSHKEMKLGNRVRLYPAIELFEEGDKTIWGITYRMLKNLMKAVAPGAPRTIESGACGRPHEMIDRKSS